ncbi:MAG TPA: hypothetical protein VG477_03080 [Thermoanaerobaculia bacterium]|nr:hypothetical protein [Thermoanaerobaculia bacterium]
MKKKILRRTIVAILAFAAILYPVYLGVGNWIVRSKLEEWINRRPERFLIQYDTARTYWPGIVHVEGFQIRSQTRTVQWWAAADQGTISIHLWNLKKREFITDFIKAEGVSFRLRRRADAPRQTTITSKWLEPMIPGLGNPPRPAPEKLYPPKPGKRRPPWHIRLAGLELEDVREIWLEEYRFAGNARAAGGFDLRVRESFELDASRLDVASGQVYLGGKPVLTRARGRLFADIERYSPAKHRGWDVVRFVNGRTEVSGHVPSLSFVDFFVHKTRWLDTRTGGGDLDMDLRIRRGRFLPGSRVDGRPEDISLAFLDYRARGSGRVVWAVEESRGKGEPQGRLTLDFNHYRIQRQGYGTPHVRGRGLRLEVLSSEPRLPVRNLFEARSLLVEMQEAEVPRLSFYNAYLPQKIGLELTGGSGRMSGRFEAAAPEWTGTGDLRLAARGFQARYREKPLRGNLALHTRLRRIDLMEKRYDVSGSRMELTDVVMPGSQVAPWWARAHVNHAVLEPGAPTFLRANVESTLSDARPLFALFLPPERRGRALRWVENILDLKGVGATASFSVGDDYIAVPKLAISSGPAQVLGQFRLANGNRQGALYASYGRLDVGLELDGEKRDWKVLRPKKWYAGYQGR